MSDAFSRNFPPNVDAFRLATAAADRGNYPLAIGLMDYLARKSPDVPEFQTLNQAFRGAYKAEIDAAIKKNSTRSRPRISVEQLKPADRTRVLLLMKRMRHIGQLPPEPQAAAARELLDDVKKLTLEQPNLTRGWLMQSSLCLLLDDSLHGKIAGRNLEELRANESIDPKIQSLLRQLQAKGWWAQNINLSAHNPPTPK